MEYRVELIKRYSAAFPSLAKYLVGMASLTTGNAYEPDYELSEEIPTEPDYGKSRLANNPLWDSIQVRSEDGVEYTFENDPLVDAYLQKKATETEIFGGVSVIEASGAKAGEFRIRGMLWDRSGQYPESQLSDLLEIFREDGEVQVVQSRYFLYMGIDTLYVESLALPAIEGYSDSQPFVITVRETRPVTLNILET